MKQSLNMSVNAEDSSSQPTDLHPIGEEIDSPTPGQNLRWQQFAIGALMLILVLGAYFRFTGLNWDDTYHLHPDERFLTDVASLLRTTDPITYLRTSESPLNPYNVGKTFYVYGNFPMTITRFVAEWADEFCINFESLCNQRFIFFDGLQLVGRFLSGLLDLVSIIFVFLIGRRLYDWRAGLIGAFLLAAAVLPIQQSHFFTMDNWAAAFTTIAMYAAVRASEDGQKKRWWVLFGLCLGLALASRINLAPLAVMAAVAATVWLARRASLGSHIHGWRYLTSDDGSHDLQRAIVGVLLAGIVSIVAFRLAQPYAFTDSQIVRETSLIESGILPGPIETTIKSIIGFNPQWRANMAEIQSLQSPDATFPPALQWTDRTPILFPFTNMVLWGMGITAGLAAWLGFLWALYRIIRFKPDWTSHFLLVSWTGLYFLFMATRWVKSIRYFLPIYPFLFLLAGWALIEIWQRAKSNPIKKATAAFLILLVIVPTLLWAIAFSEIFKKPVTRVEASEWMFRTIPSAATLLYESNGNPQQFQLPIRRYDLQPGGPPLITQFSLPDDSKIQALRFNYLSDPDAELLNDSGESLHLLITNLEGTQTLVDVEKSIDINGPRQIIEIELPEVSLTAGSNYILAIEAGPGGPISVQTSVLANEHWDDSLPVRYEGLDPYSMYYEGLSEGLMPITYPDNEEKKQNFYRWLDESDYIVLSSQRAVWSIPRLPLTYPLTTRYYEALFSGELGFELINQFHADLHIGPLYISDVAGGIRWGSPVELGWPAAGILAAEEAFSVYDHPPVWIFAKTDEYDPEKVRQILEEVDLSEVIVMTPGQATKASNGLMLNNADQALQRTNGTFRQVFNLDGILSNNPGLAAVVWWLAVVILGWITFPLAYIAFSGLPDRGYPIARILSLLFISYFVWLMASLRAMNHTRETLLMGMLLVISASALVTLVKRDEIGTYIRNNFRLIIIVELLGLALYIVFIVIRLGNPDLWDVIWGGEKPMDLSYFNAVMKSSIFPPYDPWFAGGYINYYYYGFVYVGVLTKLLGIMPAVAYNLILPMLGSFTGIGAFTIAYNIVEYGIRWRRPPKGGIDFIKNYSANTRISTTAITAGFVSVALIVLLGNLAEVGLLFRTWYMAGDVEATTGIQPFDTVVRTIDGALDLTLTDEPAPIYPGDWFWSATRAINAEEGEVQPITEFPFFTFLYGDLHAHMIALPLTLLALGWAISVVFRGNLIGSRECRKPTRWELLITWIVGALSIGVLRATNTWDFPTYLLLGVLAIGYAAFLENGRFSLKSVSKSLVHVIILITLSIVLYLPFSENYSVPYSSFSLWSGSYTRFFNYFAIYGLFLFLITTYLVIEFRDWTKSWTQKALARWEPFAIPVLISFFFLVVAEALFFLRGYWIAPVVLPLVILSGILAIRPRLPIQRRLILSLLTAALSLTLLVEFIVLDGDIGRMNTVFKFYMQVWVILSVVCGPITIWAWSVIKARPTTRRIWRFVLVILVLAAALYPILATKAKWDIRMSDNAPITLDGMAFMQTTSYADMALDGSSKNIQLDFDYQAIQWMQRNIDGSPVIAEAHGNNPYRAIVNRVSMYTGLPSIVGWDWHQRQQRAVLPASIVSNRINDVNTLFNTTNLNETINILDKYDVSYIYVGPLEWTYYNPQGLLKFDQMVDQGYLREIYRNEGVSIYEVVA